MQTNSQKQPVLSSYFLIGISIKKNKKNKVPIIHSGFLNKLFAFTPILSTQCLLSFSRACLKPPACYGKQMLSLQYYFSKHSYPLPCYFLWSVRPASLTFFFTPSSPKQPSPPVLSMHMHVYTETLSFSAFSPPCSILSFRRPAETDWAARLVHGDCGRLKFSSSVLCQLRAKGARWVRPLRFQT